MAFKYNVWVKCSKCMVKYFNAGAHTCPTRWKIQRYRNRKIYLKKGGYCIPYTINQILLRTNNMKDNYFFRTTLKGDHEGKFVLECIKNLELKAVEDKININRMIRMGGLIKYTKIVEGEMA